MTNSQILKKAIEKAVRNGYNDLMEKSGSESDADIEALVVGTIGAYGGYKDLKQNNWYYPLIFSHSFAKAFWGEYETVIQVCVSEMHAVKQPLWKSRLQEMVLKENPLDYLKKFI